MAALNALGRILLALIFVVAGIAKLFDYERFEGLMLAHKMPAVPVLLPLTIAVEVIGALLVATGYQARIGAALLIAFIIPATLIFHTSLVLPIQPGLMAEFQQQNLMKNLAILGALILVLVNGPGPGSLGAKRR